MTEKSEFVEMTADIVSAYVSNSSISVSQLPALIQQVYVRWPTSPQAPMRRKRRLQRLPLFR